MTALIIIGIIVAIIAAIMSIPIGADVAYEGGDFRLSAKVCGMLLQLLPKPPADESKLPKEKKPKKPKKEKKAKAQPAEGEPKPKKKLKFNFNKDEILSLVKAVLRGFGKFGRKLKVDRFLLHYTAGGKDPYSTAMTYGYVNGALSSLAPICSKRFEVKDCDVWTDVNFINEKSEIEFGIAVTIRIGSIFNMVFTIIFGALGIIIKNKVRLLREKRIKGKTNPALGEEPAENINATEKENIQGEERMDANG